MARKPMSHTEHAMYSYSAQTRCLRTKKRAHDTDCIHRTVDKSRWRLMLRLPRMQIRTLGGVRLFVYGCGWPTGDETSRD